MKSSLYNIPVLSPDDAVFPKLFSLWYSLCHTAEAWHFHLQECRKAMSYSYADVICRLVKDPKVLISGCFRLVHQGTQLHTKATVADSTRRKERMRLVLIWEVIWRWFRPPSHCREPGFMWKNVWEPKVWVDTKTYCDVNIKCFLSHETVCKSRPQSNDE